MSNLRGQLSISEVSFIEEEVCVGGKLKRASNQTEAVLVCLRHQ